MASLESRFYPVEASSRGIPRRLDKEWDTGLIIASIAVSLLGAFTSTQLICQAKTSAHIAGAFVWTLLSSLTFGFTAIWSLHQTAMLACELDVPVTLHVPLTILSAIIAVVFTYVALSIELLWRRARRRKDRRLKRHRSSIFRRNSSRQSRLNSSRKQSEEEDLLLPDVTGGTQPHGLNGDIEPASAHFQESSRGAALLRSDTQILRHTVETQDEPSALRTDPLLAMSAYKQSHPQSHLTKTSAHHGLPRTYSGEENAEDADGEYDDSTEDSSSQHSSSFTDSTSSMLGLGNILSVKTHSKRQQWAQTGSTLWHGITVWNVLQGFVFSVAVGAMHFIGLYALQIPDGYVVVNPYLGLVSATLGWVVGIVGAVCMTTMETHLVRQLLFSCVTVIGVAGMHFIGMAAATFYSYQPPHDTRGYPPNLALTIAGIGVATCLIANGLLAHAATLSRDKLAEIVRTRKKLWSAVAQKESAEAAAIARSDFIATASHEIRTPLHQIVGLSDLLARTSLDKEGRLLLFGIQDATKTLSLITSNVLDWSRLEKNGETTSHPVAIDMRLVIESIINVLPNREESSEVELIAVVSPDVPHSLLLDETYIQRILMNLLSNALKFTSLGYASVVVKMEGENLVATVSDTGSGIPPTFMPHLFEPFKQAQSRGAQQGTGLGLSLVKQLLDKMGGNISVESHEEHSLDQVTRPAGSTFTVTIPMAVPTNLMQPELLLNDAPQTVAILQNDPADSRTGAIAEAWTHYKYNIQLVSSLSEINESVQYIWVDLSTLQQQPSTLKALLRQSKQYVLVPVDEQAALQQVLGSTTAAHIIPLQRPLIWHTIIQQLSAIGPIENTSHHHHRLNTPRLVRFSSKVDVLDEFDRNTVVSHPPAQPHPQPQIQPAHPPSPQKPHPATQIKPEAKPPSHPKYTILLVEDNKINQRLGVKMLTALGYEVIVAEDGQEAVDTFLAKWDTIDAILMDQSMPRKDGLTATREIRDLEKESESGPLVEDTDPMPPSKSVETETTQPNGTTSSSSTTPTESDSKTRKRRQRIPIIAVTAVVSSQAQSMCQLAGTDDFLAKPLGLKKLEQCLDKHLKEKERE